MSSFLKAFGSASAGLSTDSSGVSVVSADGKVGFTPLGGIAIKMVNLTGNDSVKGTVVENSESSDNGFDISEADGDHPMGVVYDSGIANGQEAWIVVAGIAQVLLEDGEAATNGYWVRTGVSTAGRTQMQANAPGAVAAHFKEVGHSLETYSAGSDVLVKVVLHFN